MEDVGRGEGGQTKESERKRGRKKGGRRLFGYHVSKVTLHCSPSSYHKEKRDMCCLCNLVMVRS